MNSKLSNSISNLILIFMVSLNILMLFNKTLYDIYSSYSLYIMFIFVIALIIFNPRKFRFKELSFVFITTIYLFLDSTMYTNAFGSAITLLLSILLIIVISKIQISREFFLVLYTLMIALNSFLFYKSIVYNNIGAIGFNSNQMAMNMFVSYLYILILSRNYKFNYKLSNILSFVFTIINIIGINNFESRTTFVSLIFFLIMFLLMPKRVLLKKSIFRRINFLVVFASIFVPYVYTYVWSNNIKLTYQMMGKRLFTGREMMWNELFRSLNSIPKVLFGLGDNMVYSNGLLNTHNVTLHIIMSCGLVAFILYYIFIFSKFERLLKFNLNVDRMAIDFYIAFLSTIIYGYFENPLQTDRMIFIYMFISFFCNESLQVINNKDKKFKVKRIKSKTIYKRKVGELCQKY